MISLLAKLFIKNADDTAKASVRQAYGILCGGAGIGFNVLLFLVKFIAGQISGSIAITADAFNNLSDAGSSVITLLVLKWRDKSQITIIHLDMDGLNISPGFWYR